MNRLVQSTRHYTNVVIDRLRPLLPLNARQLFWGLGAAAVLLPATAYAWWHQDPAASSVRLNDQSRQSTAPHAEQPAPVKVDTDLHVDAGSSGAPSPAGASSSEPVDNTRNARLRINGEEVPLPSQGTVHKVFSSQGGKTSVDVSVDSTASGTSHSQTSTDIELNSTTESDITDVN